MKYRLILGLIILIIEETMALTVAAGPAYPNVGEQRSTPAHEQGFITYTTANGLPDNKVWDVAFDTHGHAWVGTYASGASVFNGQGWSTYGASQGIYDAQAYRFVPTADGLVDADVHAILATPDGRIWFGTGGGISLLIDGLWLHYTYAADGLASNVVEALAVDAAGDIWATHLAEGVSRFDGQTWINYTVEDGLADNWVHAVAVDGDGRLWFGTNGGVSQYDGRGWTSYTTADGLVDDTVLAVAVTPNGHLWFGTAGGVSEFDGQTWTTHLAAWAVADMAVAPAGDLWAVGGGHVRRLVRKETAGPGGVTWTDHLPDHFAGQDLRAVAVDPAGRVWIGSFGAGITVFNPHESLSSEHSGRGTAQGSAVVSGQNRHNCTSSEGLEGRNEACSTYWGSSRGTQCPQFAVKKPYNRYCYK